MLERHGEFWLWQQYAAHSPPERALCCLTPLTREHDELAVAAHITMSIAMAGCSVGVAGDTAGAPQRQHAAAGRPPEVQCALALFG